MHLLSLNQRAQSNIHSFLMQLMPHLVINLKDFSIIKFLVI